MKTRSGQKYLSTDPQSSSQKRQSSDELKTRKVTPKPSPKTMKKSPKKPKTSPKPSPKPTEAKKKSVIKNVVAPVAPVVSNTRSRRGKIEAEVKEVDQKKSEETEDVVPEPVNKKAVAPVVSSTRSRRGQKNVATDLPSSPQKQQSSDELKTRKVTPKPSMKTMKKSPKKAKTSQKSNEDKKKTDNKKAVAPIAPVEKAKEDKEVDKSATEVVPQRETRTRSGRNREPEVQKPEPKKREIKSTKKSVELKANKKSEQKEMETKSSESVDQKPEEPDEEIVTEKASEEVEPTKQRAQKRVVKPKTKKNLKIDEEIDLTSGTTETPEVIVEEKKTIEEPIEQNLSEKSEQISKQEIEIKSNEMEVKSIEMEMESNELGTSEDIEEIKILDTTEEDMDFIAIESEVVSHKRKSEETDDIVPESSKRIKITRFDVPIVPQVCGQLYSFGDEIAGELGPRQKRWNDTKVKSNEPSVVTDKDGSAVDNVVEVVCGAMHSCCLTSEAKVITFGCNDDSALGRDTQTAPNETDDSIDTDESEEREARTPRLVSDLPDVVKMTAGDMHTCALCKDGSVYVWGNFKDESKKLGLFADSQPSDDSDNYSATAFPQRIELNVKIVDIASGCHHILLLTADGEVLSFGEGSKGQLGRIDRENLQSITKERNLFLNPAKVKFEEEGVVERVWARHWSSYAKTSSGDVYVWGLNNYHQLGFKSEGVVELSSADPNESQQTSKVIMEFKPMKATKMPSNVVMIANGQHHMLALDSDGQVFSCGSNLYGKLGYKTEDNKDQAVDTPRPISREAFDGQKVSYISCGEFCSFAITESGHLYSWGQGSTHIGSKDFTDIEVPTRVRGVLADTTRFVAVSSGSQHTLVIGNESTINGN